jgi:hypothetical protein
MKDDYIENSMCLVIRECVIWGINIVIEIISQSDEIKDNNIKEEILNFKKREYFVKIFVKL